MPNNPINLHFEVKTDDKENGTYDKVVIATMLMAMNIGVFCLGIWTIVYAFPDCKSAIEHCARNCKKRCCRCPCSCCTKRKKRKTAQALTKVETIKIPAPGIKNNGNKYKHKI